MRDHLELLHSGTYSARNEFLSGTLVALDDWWTKLSTPGYPCRTLYAIAGKARSMAAANIQEKISANKSEQADVREKAMELVKEFKAKYTITDKYVYQIVDELSRKLIEQLPYVSLDLFDAHLAVYQIWQRHDPKKITTAHARRGAAQERQRGRFSASDYEQILELFRQPSLEITTLYSGARVAWLYNPSQ